MKLIVVAVEPLYPANLGFVARSMKNFGIRDLYIVNPRMRLEESYRYAAHASDILRQTRIIGSVDAIRSEADLVVGTTAKANMSKRRISRRAISPRLFAERCAGYRGVVAIVLGREDNGLSNDELEKCDLLVSIRADRRYSTLNVSHAAAIIFYELFTRSGGGEHLGTADSDLKEVLERHFRALIEKVCSPEHKRRLALAAFKNILARSFITRREASLLAGIFRRAALKIPDLRIREEGSQTPPT